jgi:uncharacterized protein
MTAPDFEQAQQYALTRLERDLSPNLFYHSLQHTRDDVLPATERLAALEGLEGESLLLLRTAALFHDLGFVERYADNEVVAARLATEVLPQWGYTPKQVQAIDGMIMATRLPQAPRTPLEEILADADLDVLGRKDFFDRNQALRAEMAAHSRPVSDHDWYDQQLRFLQGHHYFTASARRLRDAQKGRNLERLAILLAQAQA